MEFVPSEAYLIDSSAMRRLSLAAVLLAALPAALLAGSPTTPERAPEQAIPPGVAKAAQAPKDETPFPLRLIIRPLKRGMLVRLPIIDTDPNRGVTMGAMPIWVIQEKDKDRIEQIHAPSITYNQIFGPIPTYRYYYYPTDDSSLILRGSLSTQEEREALGQFEDSNFLDKGIDLYLKVQYNADGAKRFYGLGPDSPKLGEANYVEHTLQYKASGGVPLRPGSRWSLHLHDHLMGLKTTNGRTPNLPSFDLAFPGVAPRRFQQTHELGTRLTFDSRDHGVTTGQGSYLNMGWSFSSSEFASQQDYARWLFDGRTYHPWKEGLVTAAQLRYEQLVNDAPFWLKPSMGGKYSLRAYGDGRYYDRGAMTFNLEQRFTVAKIKMAGVTTEFEAAPFVGAGTVFDHPGRLARRYIRPVVGFAGRAVAKPQVVGSIDIGVGREGAAVFIDINYSF